MKLGYVRNMPYTFRISGEETTKDKPGKKVGGIPAMPVPEDPAIGF